MAALVSPIARTVNLETPLSLVSGENVSLFSVDRVGSKIIAFNSLVIRVFVIAFLQRVLLITDTTSQTVMLSFIITILCIYAILILPLLMWFESAMYIFNLQPGRRMMVLSCTFFQWYVIYWKSLGGLRSDVLNEFIESHTIWLSDLQHTPTCCGLSSTVKPEAALKKNALFSEGWLSVTAVKMMSLKGINVYYSAEGKEEKTLDAIKGFFKMLKSDPREGMKLQYASFTKQIEAMSFGDRSFNVGVTEKQFLDFTIKTARNIMVVGAIDYILEKITAFKIINDFLAKVIKPLQFESNYREYLDKSIRVVENGAALCFDRNEEGKITNPAIESLYKKAKICMCIFPGYLLFRVIVR